MRYNETNHTNICCFDVKKNDDNDDDDDVDDFLTGQGH